MGCCLSKKEAFSNSKPYVSETQQIDSKKIECLKSPLKLEVKKREEKEEIKEEEKKKEVFVIQHRKSSDKRCGGPESGDPNKEVGRNIMGVRTSSCTKEEVDAILIQCGRLSRSSSGHGRRYSGSKRSYDFDRENENEVVPPSRSREREQSRSGSRERSQRVVSRSPNRRSGSPINVSVASKEKGNVGDGNVKRVLVKRNAARANSPVRPHSPLSRNGSKRTPLNDIDINSLPLSNNKANDFDQQPILSGSQQNKFAETNNAKVYTHRRTNSRGNFDQMADDKRGQQLDAAQYDAMVTPFVVSGAETLKLPQTLMRSRSARRSRDLHINVEALLTPTAPTPPATDYNSLLLQDIHNFHQKKSSNANASNSAAVDSNNNAANTPYTLPSCVSKACSIVEAVADLNSTTGSNHSSLQYSHDRRKTQREGSFSYHNGHKRADSKHPFVESEVKVGDDLMEPSMHKYVTVRMKGGDFHDEESSGSNSYVGGNAIQQNWVSSSSWEPTSAESTDCWTSKSYSREELSPAGFQRHAISDFASGINEESEWKLSKGGVAPRVRTVDGKAPISSTSKIAAASM